MTTLEPFIAEVARRAFDRSTSNDIWGDVARAVIGVLPKADVSDETISWWMPPCSDADKAEAVSDLRREVIDPMAVRHAALLDGYIDQLRLANEAVDELVAAHAAEKAEWERQTRILAQEEHRDRFADRATLGAVRAALARYNRDGDYLVLADTLEEALGEA